MSTDAANFLMGGGLKGARFVKGQPVKGVISADPAVRQQTDFKTKEPKFFKNTGEPMMQLVVTVRTDQRDPEIPNDDGTRGFYIKGNLTKTVRDAVRAAGANNLEMGGELTLTWVSGGPRYEGDQNWPTEAPKVHTASYVKPTNQAAAAFLGAAQPAAPVPAAQQQYAPGFAPQPPFQAPAPALPPLPPPAAPAAQIQPCPAGVDPGAWAALSDEQRAQYLAVLAGRTA